MDILSFDDLVHHINKIRSRERADRLMLAFYAAQAEQKSVNELMQKILA